MTSVAQYGESTLSPAQLELRKTGIGASEVAAICGLDHRRTPLDIWMRKLGLDTPQPDNTFLRWGRRMEGVIRDAYETDVLGRAEGHIVIQPGTLIHPEAPWMLCTPDGIVSAADTRLPIPGAWQWGLECKNRDLRVAYLWGDSGTDEIPDDVAAQCHWSMAVTGLKRWDCAALIGGNDSRVYTLHWDEDIASDFIAIAHEFWHKNVLGGVEPAITGPSARDYLKKKFAKHGAEIITATPDVESLIETYGVFKARIKELQRAVDETELQLQAAVGNAAGVKGKAGVYTWKATKSGGTDWKGLAESYAPGANRIAEWERPGFRKGLWTPTKEKR